MKKITVLVCIVVFMSAGCGFEYDHLERGKHFLRSGWFQVAYDEFNKVEGSSCEKNFGLLIANLGMIVRMVGSIGTMVSSEGLLPLAEGDISIDPLVYEMLKGVHDYIQDFEAQADSIIDNNCPPFDPGGPIPLVLGNTSSPILDMALDGVWKTPLVYAISGILNFLDGFVSALMGINFDVGFSALMELLEEAYTRSISQQVPEYFPPLSEPIRFIRSLARVVGPSFLQLSNDPTRSSIYIKSALSFAKAMERFIDVVDPDTGVFFSPAAKAECDPEKDVLCYGGPNQCMIINAYDITRYEESEEKCVLTMGSVCIDRDFVCFLLGEGLFSYDYLKGMSRFFSRLRGAFLGGDYPVGISELNALIPPNIASLLSSISNTGDMSLQISFPATLSIYINKLFPASPEVAVTPSAFLPATTVVQYDGVSVPEFLIEGEIGADAPSSALYVKKGDASHFDGYSVAIPRDCIAVKASSTDLLIYTGFTFTSDSDAAKLFLVNLQNVDTIPGCALPAQWVSGGWKYPDSFAFNAVINDLLIRVYTLIEAIRAIMPVQ